jgi:Fe2+ or Zn2+ uptake regulation protein
MTNPITIDRFAEQLQKLHDEMTSGQLKHSEYDQKLSRVIHELRERGIDADRPAIYAKLDQLLQAGVITPSVKSHLENRLGLV